MSSYTYLPDDVLIRRAIDALFDALGPVEATRFLNLARVQPINAVEWHRQWQQGLDQKAFLDAVFGEETSTPSPPPENG